jgi:hypothetical protein
MSKTQKSPERAAALQKYLLLHSQHDALRKHISHITTSAMSSPSHSPDRSRHSSLSSSPNSDTSPSSSTPKGRHHARSGSQPSHSSRPVLRKRRSSLPTVIDESILEEVEEDELKLKDINLQIKSTLTELLNCESVRGDRRYRMWVQTRLMDAEKELKIAKTRSCERRKSEDMGMVFD